jgi:hypothetical protein
VRGEHGRGGRDGVGDHGAIADAGETIVDLLRDRMADLVNDDKQIVLASPVDDDLQQKVRLTVYLFDVDRTGHSQSGERRGSVADDALALDLKYLLTAHPGQRTSSTTTTTETLNEHKMLGRAMQVLHDNAIVRGPDLRGSLADGDEVLELSVLPETTDTVVNVWNTFEGEPYRPSVSYLATPVTIEPREPAGGERVTDATFKEYLRTGGDDE